MDNIYNQICKMELTDLQDKLVNLQNILISMYTVKEEIWKYHPSNEDFINPIKGYDDLLIQIDKLEKQISEVELKISHLSSLN